MVPSGQQNANLAEIELDLVLSALADANRRKMIRALRSGVLTVEALREPLGISTWGTMKHIQILEDCGLVKTEKLGRSRYCQLHPDRLSTVIRWIDDIQSFWTGNLERLISLVEEVDDSI